MKVILNKKLIWKDNIEKKTSKPLTSLFVGADFLSLASKNSFKIILQNKWTTNLLYAWVSEWKCMSEISFFLNQIFMQKEWDSERMSNEQWALHIGKSLQAGSSLFCYMTAKRRFQIRNQKYFAVVLKNLHSKVVITNRWSS